MTPSHRVLYPVTLDVWGRACLVVGGGPVAARKAAGLARCGAQVTLVAPATVGAVDELARPGRAEPGSVTVAHRAYLAGEAASYRLVVAATGRPEVDRRVAADAEAAGVWVNCADDGDHCTFQLPSVHRDGPVTVAISTGGASPALATWLRQRMGVAAGRGLADLAALLDAARRRLQDQGRSTDSVDWQGLLDGPLPNLVADGRLEEAQTILDEAIPAVPGAGSPPSTARP